MRLVARNDYPIIFQALYFEANTSKPRCHDVMPRTASTMMGHHVNSHDAHSNLRTWVDRLGRRETRLFLAALPRWLAPSSSAKGGAASSEKDLHERPKDPKERKKSSPRHPSQVQSMRVARRNAAWSGWQDLESGVCLDFLCSSPSCSTRGCVVVVVDAATPRAERPPPVGSRTTNECETTTGKPFPLQYLETRCKKPGAKNRKRTPETNKGETYCTLR